ncbi:hypothetical protein L226DRAFT_538678 [Lentinus tigrinus ALCF2SS1-7]|uniref:uncharacterized protein n=1 Tax=Lentinus tigrinus ALCF2SS1-7 TaxID=1328758 RepID=UPI001165EEDB|nr:hypothetical protein L226DRAFT_538678 [Lentinus tigrinus ALCF2SS1-7]
MAVLPHDVLVQSRIQGFVWQSVVESASFPQIGGVSMKPRPLATEAFGLGVVAFVRRMGIALLASSARLVIAS